MKGRSSYWLWLGLAVLLGLFSQRDRLGHADTPVADRGTASATAPLSNDHDEVSPGTGQTHRGDEGDDGSAAFARAFEQHRSNIQLAGEGEVIKVLPDDNKGSRHQRLLVRLAPTPEQRRGQVILIAHNIDLAPRVDNVSAGDRIGFLGEYEWTDKGGVLHWTHRDPGGRHPAGWLRHDGQTYR